MPSGHSMMAIILLEFVVRFYARVHKFVAKYIAVFYFFIILFEICVMFSRVILGMHSFNQVLLGCLIGCYTFVPYYLFAEKFILKWVLSIFRSQKSVLTSILLVCICCVSFCSEILLAMLLPF
jgi:membrane-associated phospholipid phosphatase